MPIPRITRRSDRGARALKRLAAIETSIADLHDEDLLDLADIFSDLPDTPIGQLATAEMARRGIAL